MFKKVSAYIGEYKKYTVWAAVLMSLGIVAHVIPYYFLYQIIAPLTRGEHIDLGYIMIRVAGVAVCEILFSFLYVQGLSFSHVSAYYTLTPDPADKAQRVSFGTSGHRGSSVKRTFNEDHIAAITQANAS